MNDPRRDTDFEIHTIKSVRPEKEDGWSITYEDGWSFWIKGKHGVEPKPGDEVKSWGGPGRPVRGLALNGRVLFYQTEKEHRAEYERKREEEERAKKAEADANREQMDARVAALPEAFRRRIERFRRNNSDFYWKYEGYEMASCVDAVKIASAALGAQADAEREAGFAADPVAWIQNFSEAGYERQRGMVPGLADGHSGNTFGMAVRLAHHYVTDERLVFADHAAIAPLTGCECGCPPVTDEEMVAAGYEPFAAAAT